MIEYFSNPAFWVGLGQIIVVNILLSGDNAVVIALAARSLPPHQQKKAIIWGSVAAIDGDTCEFTTGDDDLGWLALRIAMLGVECEVHEPPELREQLGSLADRLTRAVG